jgi:PilZ domain
MKPSDRRLAQRFLLSIPVFVREWKTMTPEKKVESVNVSEGGVYFETDTPPREGAAVQIRLEMPREITGDATAEWRCTGKVVGVRPTCPPGGSLGVGVRFDYYEIMRVPGPLPGPPFLALCAAGGDSGRGGGEPGHENRNRK